MHRIIVLFSLSLALADPKGPGTPPTLLEHVGRDPLGVWQARDTDLDRLLDDLLAFVRRLDPEGDAAEFDHQLAELDAKMGCSLRRDLLARVGPELVLAGDLPPIDQIVAAGAAAPAAAVPGALRGVGLLARVREPAQLDACLRKLLALGKAEITEEQGLIRARFPLPSTATPGKPPAGGGQGADLYYGFKDGVLALGFAAEYVRAGLAPRPTGQRLADSVDFARVAAQLDPSPRTLTYLNLPRLGRLVADSKMAQMLLSASPQARRYADMFLAPEALTMGIGTSTVEVEGGTRTTSFAPREFTGTSSMAMLGAVAVPNLFASIERGKQKRTMADLRSIATGIEEYSIDENHYPRSEDGFVPLERIVRLLEPVYIRQLPRQDGWGGEILYWSDGQNYRLVSPGKDGKLDRTWSGPLDEQRSDDPNADIVFADGKFVVWPEGLGN